MAIKEKTKLWLIGAGATALVVSAFAALRRISNFVDQLSFTPSVRSFRITGANLLNMPPILGNAQLGIDIRIDNPLSHSHTISDFSIRIYDTTVKGSQTQIGNSLPRSEKYHIAAGGSTTISGVQVVVPVAFLFSQINIDTIKTMINTGLYKLGRKYDIRVDLRIDGVKGSTTTQISI